MTEFITRNHGNKEYEVIIKTDNKEHYMASEYFARKLIDHAKHVTDNNVGCKWIPVGERKPDLIPCDAGTAYSEAVIVCTSGKKIMVAVWDGIDFLCDMDYWEAWGEQITHWVPIDWLLPLPELPKEDAK